MVSSQFSTLNGNSSPKPFRNKLLLPSGTPDFLDFEFSDVFGPCPVEASTALSCEKPGNLVVRPIPSEKVYNEKGGALDLWDEVFRETQEELNEYYVNNAAVEKNRLQFNDYCQNHKSIGVEDFEVLKVVGQGAFGKVYQVRRAGTSEIYAMKVMCKDKIMQRNHDEYVKSERDILTKVDHPFIVRLRYSFQVMFFT